MKHHGSKCDFEKERNRDLMRAYHHLIRECRQVSLPDIYRNVVAMPAARFWVSAERATIVCLSMLKGDTLEGMKPNKRAMFCEIFRRFLRLKRLNPTSCVSDIVAQVVHQPAPQFYLTPGTAKVIITRIRSSWYAEKKPHAKIVRT